MSNQSFAAASKKEFLLRFCFLLGCSRWMAVTNVPSPPHHCCQQGESQEDRIHQAVDVARKDGPSLAPCNTVSAMGPTVHALPLWVCRIKLLLVLGCRAVPFSAVDNHGDRKHLRPSAVSWCMNI